MKTVSIEDQIENAIEILSEFVPQKTGFYFPVISSALVWLVNRHQDWEKSIFSWQIWPDPEFLRNKPDEFVLDFFCQKDSLKQYFRKEIEAKDMDFLRNAFHYLYPIFGLKDPFLNALFKDEIQSKNFKDIIIKFDEKVNDAKQSLSFLRGNKEFTQKLGTVIKEIGALCAGVLSQKEIQQIVADIVKEKIQKKED
ncbi:MAG: hypothetical protein ACOC5S_00225 [Acidobacteriota bacterium]